MEVQIPYSPHPKQNEVHMDGHRFKVIAAGRRSGKTTLAINELVKQALQSPNGRSWYVAPTYRQAKSTAWDDIERGIFKYLPDIFIKQIYRSELSVHLTNGHIIEFKGSENRDKLRGAALNYVVLDEYGQMAPDVWPAVVRPMLTDTQGRALFIGTPHLDGSPHFHDLYKQGQTADPDFKSWMFFTRDNERIPGIKEEVDRAQKELPPDIFKREYEADFSVSEGLVYDNFRQDIHIIPTYEPNHDDIIVGSIDPGLSNETAGLLTAWDKRGVGRCFKEYYQKEFDAHYNANELMAWSKGLNVSYWVIDRATIRREQNGGPTVYNIYRQYLKPLYLAPNDPGSVNYGINEVKKLLQPDSKTKESKLYICSDLTNFQNEIIHYSKYRPRYNTQLNLPDKPRKYRDHLMDCIRNMVMTQPWRLRTFGGIVYAKTQDKYTGY